MADELPDFPEDDPFETNGRAISRSLGSSRGGSASRIPQQFRERQQTAREQDQSWRRNIAQEKFDLEKSAVQAQREAATLRAAEVKFNLLTKMSDMRQKHDELNHSISAMEEFNGLDYKDGATPNRIADIYKRNPRALDNPRVAAFADKLLGMHETYLKDFRADAQTATKKAELDKANTGLQVTQTVDDGITRKLPETGQPKAAPTVKDINSRLKAEFGVELSKLQEPGVNMRRVNPAIKDPNNKGVNGDSSGSHYAFNVADKDGNTKPVLIPVDRFKAYADEYAAATAQPSVRVGGNGAKTIVIDRASDTPSALSPSTAAGNPRLALAQKALDDPGASEAHKAAARKILGQ